MYLIFVYCIYFCVIIFFLNFFQFCFNLLKFLYPYEHSSKGILNLPLRLWRREGGGVDIGSKVWIGSESKNKSIALCMSVRLSVRPSVCPSVCPSVRPHDNSKNKGARILKFSKIRFYGIAVIAIEFQPVCSTGSTSCHTISFFIWK